MPIEAFDAPILAFLFSFATLFLFIVGLYYYFRQKTLQSELKEKILGGGIKPTLTMQEEEEALKGRASEFFMSVGKLAATEKSAEYSLQRLPFLRAGLRNPRMPLIVVGVRWFLAILFPLAFMALRFSFFQILDWVIVVAAVVFLFFLGTYLPTLWLRIRTAKRKNNIFKALPDALDLLVVCVEAGMGLDAALNRVAEEIKFTHSILAEELKLYNLEMRAGKSREGALRNLAARIDLEAITSLVAVLVQTEKFGTSIARALRVYSDSFRTTRYLQAEEKAAKLPVKLVVVLILFIFPALFVAILGPSAIRAYETFFKG